MCGIAGIIDFSGKPVLQADLVRMTNSVKHRGPDGEGFFVDNGVGLAHRRLSIIDLSNGGAQPMQRFGYVLTFNGEIYNYIELRTELIALGYQFSSSSDSEVLLAAYKCWGTSCVNRFNGMWSFAIYDPERQVVFCSRDRFGKKPFFFCRSNQRFIFCSEIKGILAAGVEAKANWKTLSHFVAFNQTDITNQSFFDGIDKLPAGCNGELNLRSGEFIISRYYSIARRLGSASDPESVVVERFAAEFERSVTWRLRSDVPVGTCLSGGLDSSYLALIAGQRFFRQSGQPFSAITAGSVDARWDESGYAKMVVDHCGLRWVHTLPDTSAFLTDFDRVVHMQEEPFHSSSVFMQYFVMKAAREAGMVVLLDGQGADEVLLGYNNHITTFLRRLPLLKRWQEASKISDNFGVSPMRLAQLYFYYNSSWLRSVRQMHKWRHMHAQVRKDYIDFDHIRKLKRLAQGNLFDYQEFEIFENNLPMLLRYEDRNSMAFSIESRLPFLDYSVVETVLNAPEDMRIKHGWSKYILRKAMQGNLPDEIVWRKKKFGFIPPDEVWLSDRKYFEDMISSSTLLNRMFKKLEFPHHDLVAAWRLISVAAWERVFGVKP